MKVGVTGTRYGATPVQHQALVTLLEELRVSELHHGDCRGIDDQAASAARGMTHCLVRVVCHPPEKSTWRVYSKAHTVSGEIRERRSYQKRNRAIVDETEVLVACPAEMTEQSSGGTWQTVRYGRSRNKPLYIVWPNGVVTSELIQPTMTPQQELFE